MNVREGFRRVGLVLGLAGMTAGLVAGYGLLQKTLQQRWYHNAFSTRLNSLEANDAFPPPSKYGGYLIEKEFTAEHPNKQKIHKILYASKDPNTAIVRAFEMEDGGMLYPTDPPTLSSYLLPISLPILGFIVPWGFIKLLVWIGSGFTQKAS